MWMVGGTETTAGFDRGTTSRSDTRVRDSGVAAGAPGQLATYLLMFWCGLTAGRTHTLCFKSVRPEHAGEIRFTAERVSSYATLTVKGEPADLSVSFMDRLPTASAPCVLCQSCQFK